MHVWVYGIWKCYLIIIILGSFGFMMEYEKFISILGKLEFMMEIVSILGKLEFMMEIVMYELQRSIYRDNSVFYVYICEVYMIHVNNYMNNYI